MQSVSSFSVQNKMMLSFSTLALYFLGSCKEHKTQQIVCSQDKIVRKNRTGQDGHKKYKKTNTAKGFENLCWCYERPTIQCNDIALTSTTTEKEENAFPDSHLNASV